MRGTRACLRIVGAVGVACALAHVSVLPAIGGAVTETHTLTLPGGTVTYYVTKPNGFNANATYPMIINFPGTGRDAGTVDSNQARSYSRRFMFDPTVIATNQICVGVWYTGWLNDWGDNAHNATIAVMNQMQQDFKIDTKRIFCLGFSAGGGDLSGMVWSSTYYTKATFPWAGVMVCSCNSTTANTKVAPATMPVFLEYGERNDISSCVSDTQSRYANLQAAGYTDLEIHGIPGQDHEISGFDVTNRCNPCANQLINQWWIRVNAKIGGDTNPPPALPPTISAVTVSPTNRPLVGQLLTFTAATTGGTPTSLRWTFGDGAATNGSPVTYAYASTGLKNVSAVASNAAGISTSNVTVTVVSAPSNQPPIITAVTVTPAAQALVGQLLTFTVSTSGGTATSLAWNFGDGATTNGSPVTHAYATVGARNVSAIASNAFGSSASNVWVTIVNTASVALPCSADTYVAQDANYVSNNYGTATFMISNADKVHNAANAGVPVRDALLKFDLGSLPAGAVVTSGVLHVYCSSDVSYDARFCTFQIRGLLQDWSETQATWLLRSTGNPWPGGAYAPGDSVNYDPGASGTAIKSTNELWTGTYHDIDVTPLVQSWVGGRPNDGLAIQTCSAIGALISSPKRTDFATRETANPPQLLVAYTIAGGANPQPQLTGIPVIQPDSATITWNGQPGYRYRMECTASLMNTNWTVIGEVTASATVVSMPDAGIGGVRARFYRVKSLP